MNDVLHPTRKCGGSCGFHPLTHLSVSVMTQFLCCPPSPRPVSASRSHTVSLSLLQKYHKQLPCLQANLFQSVAARMVFWKCYVYQKFKLISKDPCDRAAGQTAGSPRRRVWLRPLCCSSVWKPFQSAFTKLPVLRCSVTRVLPLGNTL